MLAASKGFGRQILIFAKYVCYVLEQSRVQFKLSQFCPHIRQDRLPGGAADKDQKIWKIATSKNNENWNKTNVRTLKQFIVVLLLDYC